MDDQGEAGNRRPCFYRIEKFSRPQHGSKQRKNGSVLRISNFSQNRKQGKTENGFEADETSWSSKLRQSDTLKTSKRRLLQPSPTFRPNFEHPTFRFVVKRSQTEVTL